MAPKVKHPLASSRKSDIPKLLPIIAVEYKNRRVAIPRSSDYDVCL